MRLQAATTAEAQRGAFVLELLIALTIVTIGVLMTANMMLRGAGMTAKANSLSQQYAEAAAMAAPVDGRGNPAGNPTAAEVDAAARSLASSGHAIGAGTLTINDEARQVTVTWGDGAASPDLRLIRLDPVAAAEQPQP